MSMNPLSVSLPGLNAFINHSFEGCLVLCCKFWKKTAIKKQYKTKEKKNLMLKTEDNKNSLSLAVFLACIRLNQ